MASFWQSLKGVFTKGGKVTAAVADDVNPEAMVKTFSPAQLDAVTTALEKVDPNAIRAVADSTKVGSLLKQGVAVGGVSVIVSEAASPDSAMRKQAVDAIEALAPYAPPQVQAWVNSVRSGAAVTPLAASASADVFDAINVYVERKAMILGISKDACVNLVTMESAARASGVMTVENMIEFQRRRSFR